MSLPAEAPGGEVLVYEAPDGQSRVDVRLDHETVWLTQAQMVDLFGRDQSVVSRHLRNVFAEGELPAEGNMQKMHVASADKPTTALKRRCDCLRRLLPNTSETCFGTEN